MYVVEKHGDVAGQRGGKFGGRLRTRISHDGVLADAALVRVSQFFVVNVKSNDTAPFAFVPSTCTRYVVVAARGASGRST